MNIYLFELGMYKKSIFIWSIAISFWIIFYLMFFPMIAGDGAAFDMIMEEFPEEFLAAFGMNSDLPMSSILGYYGLTFGMSQIPIAIQAANYGFGTLSVEERELTADFLLTKPITRRKIIVSKFFAALTGLTIVNACIWVSSILAIYLFKDGQTVDLSKVFILLSSITLFQLFFLSVGMAISVSVKKVGSVLSFSMGLSFGLYILNSLNSIFSSGFLGIFSPYTHFNPTYILVEGSYDIVYTLISVIIITISLAMSYFLYLKRNIHSL